MQIFYSYNGNANKTITLSSSAVSVGVVNAGAAAMTIKIDKIEVSIPAGATFNDIFEPFKKIIITATDSYSIVFRR